MRVYKRGEYWWCSFTWQSQTIRRSTRCTTRGAALLVAQRWERERADPDHAAAASATFGGAVTAYLSSLARTDKAAGTKTMYRQKCGVLVRHIGADTALVEVTAQRVDAFISAREKEPVAFDEHGSPTRFVTPNTIHKELVALRQVLKLARRRGEFRRDPSEVMPVGFSPQYAPRVVTLTIEQAAALVQSLPGHRAAAVAFSLATTARLAEIRRARHDDVDVQTGRVHLRGTKTAGSERTITVAPFAIGLLRFAVENGSGTDGALFAPWPNMRRGLARACARVGAPRVTANDLRRTLSTWLIEGGVSDYVVSKVLGHKTTTMVHKVYGKPREDALRDLLVRQTSAMTTVPTVYTGRSAPALPEATRSEDSAENAEKTVGRMGVEPMTYGLKGQQSERRSQAKKQAAVQLDADSVPPAYTSPRVISAESEFSAAFAVPAALVAMAALSLGAPAPSLASWELGR